MSAHRLSKEQWLRYIQSLGWSGLSQRAWGRQNGIQHRRFWYWKRKLDSTFQPVADARQRRYASAFMPVVLQQTKEPVKRLSLPYDFWAIPIAWRG